MTDRQCIAVYVGSLMLLMLLIPMPIDINVKRGIAAGVMLVYLPCLRWIAPMLWRRLGS